MALELTTLVSTEEPRATGEHEVRTFDWSSIDTQRIPCPCDTVPCIDDLDSWRPFIDWLERATERIDLESRFRARHGLSIDAGWLAIEDPDAPPDSNAPGRLALNSDSCAVRGTYESSTRRRRVDPVEQRAVAGGFDELEAGAVQLAFDAGIPLPRVLETAWAPSYWRCEAPRVLRRVADAVKRHGSRLGVSSAVGDPHAMRCMVWLIQSRPAAFEHFVLSEIEPRCERRHVRSLRAAVAGEAREHQAQVRLAREHKIPCAPHTALYRPEEVIERVLDEIGRFVQENAARIWRGRHTRGRSLRHDWIGRWDETPDAPIALDAEIVRAIVGRFGEPQQVIGLLGQRKLLRSGPTGFRWQQRVGSRRRSVYAFLPAAIPIPRSEH